MKKNSLFLILIFTNIIAFAETFNVSNVSEFRQALENVSLNGENDVIILDKGIYKTTEDGLGSFKYDDQEEANITIKAKEGLVREDVILDGNGTDTVLYFQNESDSTFTLEGVSVVNGKSKTNRYGGGLYFNKNLIIDDCNFINNNARNGGAIFADSTLTVTNSNFTNNNANDSGGAIYSYSKYKSCFVIVTNSIFSNNNNGYIGGVIYSYSYSYSGSSSVIVTNSTFFNNNEGVIYSISYGSSKVNLANSIFYSNNGGNSVTSSNIIIINSIFSNNIHYETIYSYSNTKVLNSIFSNNKGENIIKGGGFFANNIFTENNASQIYFIGDSKVYNNYVDYLKLENEEPYTVIKKNNIQPNSGEINFIDDDLRVDSNSISIDKGLNSESEIFKDILGNNEFIYESLQTDKDGNSRVSNGVIDLGAYEYGATKITDTAPIIESIEYTAPNKVFTDIYFDFNISVSDGREVANIYVDFGDGIFIEVDSINIKHQFTIAKDYEIKVKVIDSEGEEAIKSFTITISDLTTSEAIEYGKNICIKNPNECGINSTYQVSNSNLNSLANHISNLPSGWNLVGTSEALSEISDYSVFNGVDTIWTFKDNKWTLQDPQLPIKIDIKSFDGFWIKK